MVYGEDSPEAELLRYFRDTVLSSTHEGREIIKLYYEFSPALTGVMAGDEKLTSEIRAILDSVLSLARSERN